MPILVRRFANSLQSPFVPSPEKALENAVRDLQFFCLFPYLSTVYIISTLLMPNDANLFRDDGPVAVLAMFVYVFPFDSWLQRQFRDPNEFVDATKSLRTQTELLKSDVIFWFSPLVSMGIVFIWSHILNSFR